MDSQLRTVLERARALGFLGPGPVDDHVEHSAGFLRALVPVTGTVVDLGSGGGVPGLVVAMARPDLRFLLVDATAKRCRFLEEAVEQLEVDGVVVEGRAEEIGHGMWRGVVDAVMARSFGAPAVTAECAAPLLRLGGLLVVSEPPVSAPDRWPATGLAGLGLTLDVRSTTSPAIQTLVQTAACPTEFPRRVGVPAKRPLF